MRKLCAVIIPNWNGLDFVEQALTSLQRQTLPHHVIVVDNGSTDGSMEKVRYSFPEVELLAFPNNAGFAGGVNRGIIPLLSQGYEYIALLNNDAVAETDWLERLIDTARANPQSGMVTSKILRNTGKLLDSTGDFYSIWGFPFPRGRDEVDTGQYDAPEFRAVFGCSGGATLYRAKMLAEIGVFDEDFFAYFEDVDLSFRAQLNGWTAIYEPKARVSHFVGGTSSKHGTFGRYHTVKNFIYLYTKNMPGRLFWKYLWRYYVSLFLMAMSDIKRLQFDAYIKAILTAFINLPAMFIKRREIQRHTKVSIDYIESILVREMPPTQKAYLKLLGVLRKKDKVS